MYSTSYTTEHQNYVIKMLNVRYDVENVPYLAIIQILILDYIMTKKITLEEYVTSQTLISRRELLSQVHKEQVFVNEVLVSDICMQIDPDVDSIKVDGTYVEHGFSYLYYRFNKPKGTVSQWTI